MVKYRFSASFIKKYKSCPFAAYCKITGKEQDDNVDTSYADGGTAVHDSLEYYFKELSDIPEESAIQETKAYFDVKWEEANIQNPKMSKDTYWLCVINGIKLGVKPTDLEYQVDFTDPVTFIAFIDAMNTEEHWIGDWKTSTYKAAKVREYKEQLKVYAWAYRKLYGVNPMTWVFFNKVNKIFKFKFPDSTLDAVEAEMVKIDKEIKQRFKEMRFERKASRTNCFFCPYKSLCATDHLREEEGGAEKYIVTLHLKKNKLLIEGSIPDIIHRKIEKEVNFQLKNAHFIIKAMAAKGVKYDGIKRLYRRKNYGADTFIGHLHLVHKILKDYAHSQGKRLRLIMKDYRDQEVMNFKIETKDKLNVPYELYDFQKQAVDELIKYRWGICEIGTGGGKTAIAAECIRKVGTRTLFIIDNKDLLLQTKTEYEEMLECKCGIVGMGKREWDNPIVLATIQTLAKNAKQYAKELAQFNLVIYDETHIIASKSFEKVSKFLENTKYRFGFSATARRDDGNDKVIYAHTGHIVIKKRAQELIGKGVLVEPEVKFYKYKTEMNVTDDWQTEYADNIVDNETRNNMIKDIVLYYTKKGKSVMVLTKMVRHGQWFLNNIKGSNLIYGKTQDDLRVEILDKFKEGAFKVLVGNLKIFNKGINIKNLDVLINASGNAGDTTTVQSIGRALRKNEGKEKAYYIDFIDAGEYCKSHSMSRIQALKNEDYTVEILDYS